MNRIENELNYGIVVDCGSSGSRLFVYYWRQHSGVPGELLNIKNLLDKNNKSVVIKKEPGLSSFAERPSDAIEHITSLLQFAAEHIPATKVKQTPLYVMATAGLRMLTQSQQQGILSNLIASIPKQFDFIFSEQHIEVISGQWEGLYAWMSVNLALGKFDHKLDQSSLTAGADQRHVRKKTVGAMDLGGASMQTTFELPLSSSTDPHIKESVMELDLGCSAKDSVHHYRLYTQTFLGFGVNEALKRQRHLLLSAALDHLPTTITAADHTVPTSPTTPHPVSQPHNTETHNQPSQHLTNENTFSNNIFKLLNKKKKVGFVSDISISSSSTASEHSSDTLKLHQHTEQADTPGDFSSKDAISSKRHISKREVSGGFTVADPCSPVGYREKASVEASSLTDAWDSTMKNESVFEYTLEGTGDMEACLKLLRGMMEKHQCPLNKHCAMQDAVLPDVNYRNIDFYGFSEFYYTMADILDMAGKYNYQLFYNKAKEYCSTSWERIEEWRRSKRHASAGLRSYRTQCFRSAWLMTLLHDGLNLPKHYKHFTSLSFLHGNELHWSLGALLYKTRFYPLRDIERAQEPHSGEHKRWQHNNGSEVSLILLCLVIFLILYACLKSSSLMKLLGKKSRVTMTTNGDGDDDPHMVLVGEKKLEGKKMVRSRSSGVFAGPAYAEV